MLSEQEKRELLEMGRSASVRQEFERVRQASALPRGKPVNLDQVVQFLSFMSRFCAVPARPRPPISYPNARL